MHTMSITVSGETAEAIQKNAEQVAAHYFGEDAELEYEFHAMAIQHPDGKISSFHADVTITRL